ncbi:MAG: protoporphyrinogen oxidase HemJ [Pseudomonadota bacterium]
MELTVKALHIIAVIAWMVGLLYLPRLFVYHATATPGSELDQTLQTMERRLLKAIMTPAMIASWVLGIWAAANIAAFDETWMQLKIAFVIELTVLHMVFARWRKELAAGTSTRSATFFRVANEIPTVGLIAIVFLVVFRPF